MALRSALAGAVHQLNGLVDHITSGGRMVLTAHLLFRQGGSVVKLTLGVEGAPAAPAAQAALDTEPVELPIASFKGTEGLHIPRELEHVLKERIAALGPTMPRGPLWLCLVRPYGPLGLLPWESRLRAVLHRPVLRLSDAPFRPTERADVLENIVLVDPPDEANSEEVCQRLAILVDAILAGSARPETRVHIFARTALQEALVGFGAHDARILVHAPPTCAPCHPSDYVASWTSWVLEAMEQRGIDALHLLGRAARTEHDACFLLSATPHEIVPSTPVLKEGAVKTRRQPDAELSADDVALLLNRAGAWSAIFAPVTPAYDIPLAFMADDLAQRWQGAVLYVDLYRERPDVVGRATRLLYTATATAAPPLKYGFLYCHPDFLQSKHEAVTATLPPALVRQARVLAQHASSLERTRQSVQRALPEAHEAVSQVLPSWFAATQRFMEKEVLDTARRKSSDILRSQLPADIVDAAGAVKLDAVKERLLEEMRTVVARYQGGKGDDT